MCGFVVLFNRGGQPVDPPVLTAMTDLQRHRGPDDQGFHFCCLASRRSYAWQRGATVGQGGNVGLGFNRLSILDLSADGHQPMASDDGQIVLVFNGEIYNAFDIRPQLEQAGHRFRSRTDTEVLLHGYLQWGARGLLGRLNGMFALCIVDLRNGSIFAARDRLGIKPLYYWDDSASGTLALSSESKSLLAHPKFQARLNTERLPEYLKYRFLAGNETLLAGVNQVAPGECIGIDRDGIRCERWWRLPPATAATAPLQSSVDTVDNQLSQAVKRQLLSDVPLGCQLSGGVDSSLINLYAARAAGDRLGAFSLLFDDPKFSEEHWVEQAARTANVARHDFTLDSAVFADRIERASWHLDQPLNHPNSVALYYLAEQSREFVTVLLSGEGADELYGGYVRFLYQQLRPGIGPFARAVRPFARVHRALDKRFDFNRDPVGAAVAASGVVGDAAVASLLGRGEVQGVDNHRRAMFEQGSDRTLLGRMLEYESRTYLVDLLLRQDKMTMAHSLENRVPFLDHELIETVRREVPLSHLVRLRLRPSAARVSSTKIVLKHLAARYFGWPFVLRPKSGLGIPLRQFFKHPRMYQYVREELLGGIHSRGWIDVAPLIRVANNLDHARGEEIDLLWIGCALEIWARQFIDGKQPA